MRTPLALLIAFLLTGCAASTSGDAPRAAPPPSTMIPCDAPVRLPDRALSDQEIEVLWGRDRSALRACAGRHGALADWAIMPANP